ncbi:MAG: GNAT family N-acetyltransferase [Rhizobiales bacterium]|nr:GNAT family N-acetyltransferase [Hyphomicrobiales bacterium]
MPGITHVRTSVRENHLSLEQMAERGITQDGIVAGMEAGHLGCWIAEDQGQIVAFSMADRRTGNIFALFVLPGFERRGFASALISRCENDLRIHGFSDAHLDTAPETIAHRFYLRRGWQEYKKPGGNPNDVYLRKAL